MIGGERVTKGAQHTGVLERLDEFRKRTVRFCVSREEWRLPQVFGCWIPSVKAPHLIRLRPVARSHGAGLLGHEQITGRVHLSDQCVHLGFAGLNVFEKHRFTLSIDTDGLMLKINVDLACQGIGHHQGGCANVVGSHKLVNSPWEIAVARDHCGGDQLARLNLLCHLWAQWPRLAPACGAAKSDQVKAQLLQGLHESQVLQVRDHRG